MREKTVSPSAVPPGTGSGDQPDTPPGVPSAGHRDLTRVWTGKRGMDVILSLLLLLLLAPLMLLVALLVRLSSPGPILFRQERPGRGGKVFLFLKFRSMYINNEGMLSEAQRRDLVESGILPKSINDRRVTPVGLWLRRASIDELPQLINVLIGDMSLVGPRPVLPDMERPFPEIAAARLQVRPGITGLWQV